MRRPRPTQFQGTRWSRQAGARFGVNVSPERLLFRQLRFWLALDLGFRELNRCRFLILHWAVGPLVVKTPGKAFGNGDKSVGAELGVPAELCLGIILIQGTNFAGKLGLGWGWRR